MSKYNCDLISEEESDKWDAFVKSHADGTFFHLWGWLKFCERKSGYKLYPIILEKGGSIQGVYPVFLKSLFGFTVIASPPPKVSTPYLGPLLINSSDNVYKREKNEFSMIEILHQYVQDKLKPNYQKIDTATGFKDPRPFIWNNYRAKPRFTYVVSLTNIESVFNNLDGRVRTSIRKAEKSKDIFYSHDANEKISDIISFISQRYDEQKLKFPLSSSDVEKIQNSCLGKYIHVNAIWEGERLVTGNILIKFHNKIQHWLGGVKPYSETNGVNELLHWEGMKKFSLEGYSSYELIGANTKHLCDHKSKYGPELSQYFQLEQASGLGKLLYTFR